MIKKLMSLIFEEETIEEETQPEVKQPVSQANEVKLPEKKEVRIIDEHKTKSEPVKNALPEKKESSMLDKVKMDPASNSIKTKKPTVSSKPEYEFSPVISPIYGITDEKKVQVASNTQKKTYTSSSSPTGIVLSPINGNMKEEKPLAVKIEQPVDESDARLNEEDSIVDIPLANILENVTPYGTGKDTLPAAETKENQVDKKVLLSKNLSLFDDEE